ncbi:hypothetical protein DMC25_02565 [Caulobacter sp. D4A]|uniref:DNA damage-induced SOS-independent cell division inhibitor A n=1 Tax=unclassified Caulobacter TaxID=2648921 RepID=UPI000D73881A|nr:MULTISPECIES: DNA damage-induced SOS-independent cell division inhibitor A [unclassified Caulobacter]PXA91135.1 hypothetical protein DMC18_13825 [Caulobacter sp. D5]PXA94295.1 hypothetical protein DMC25_02565 [Caulobacter sp. D4A]
MTDIAMTQYFDAPVRTARRVRAGRPGRPTGVWGSISYAGVLLVWAGLFVIRPRLALQVMAQRRADSPIPRFDKR